MGNMITYRIRGVIWAGGANPRGVLRGGIRGKEDIRTLQEL